MTKETMNTTNPTVYLKGLHYFMGDLKDIAEVDFLKSDPTRLENYYKMGFKTYAESTIPMIEMAYHSLKKSLSDIDVNPADIDILLYVAESKGREETFGSFAVNTLLNYLGLKNAYPLGLNLSDCANSSLGILTAESLIKSGAAKNVLMVCTNRSSPKTNARMMSPEVAVCSDAAVSVLITSEPGDFKVLGSNLVKNEPPAENAPPLDASIKKVKALRSLTKTMLENLNLKKQDISKIFTNNYFELSQIFIESCGFDPEKGFYDNIAKYGHCLAGDTLISLKDRTDDLKKDETAFILCDGPYGSFAICLQKAS